MFANAARTPSRVTPARAAVHCNEKSSLPAAPRTKLRARPQWPGAAWSAMPPNSGQGRPRRAFALRRRIRERTLDLRQKKQKKFSDSHNLISAAARCACGHIRAAEPVRPSVGKISIAYAGAGSVASSTALRNAAFSSSAPAWPSTERIDSKLAPLATPGCRGRRRPQRRALAAIELC